MASRHHNAHSSSQLVTWVGGSCGRHGSYIFYKAFRFSLTPETAALPAGSSATLRQRTRERRSLATRADDAGAAEEPADRDNHASPLNERILSLGEFFFVQCRPEDPVCVGEVQLLWHDKHSGQDLASTRLYYLPETTPAGRTPQHGEDEMLAVSDKIVMRTSDLASWIVEPSEWNYGSPLLITPPPKNGGYNYLSGAPLHRYAMLHSCVNLQDINAEKRVLMMSAKNGYGPHTPGKPRPIGGPAGNPNAAGDASASQCCDAAIHKAGVVMLSVNAYCRHKALMKRIEHMGPDWLSKPSARAILGALGAVTSHNPKARVVFCRDTFEYPQLFEHDLICEELAPVFKGRPRKKTKKNGALGCKAGKKSTNPNPRGRNTESPVDGAKPETDASTPTRRSSSRRRSKRKSPQTLIYEEQFAPLLVRTSKRRRRTPVRTPTPVDKESEPESPGTRGFITAATVAQTVDAVADSAVDGSNSSSASARRKTKSRKRSGRRSSATALSIAIQNSLIENHKPVESWQTAEERNSAAGKKKAPNSVTSSRSSSPCLELGTAARTPPKAPSPAGSSASSAHSNDAYASSSTSASPIDFLNQSADEQDKNRNPSPIPGAELYLHGLMDGKIPENKTAFLDKLYQFMRKRNTPIGRIPSLGFKKLDLWAFFKLSQEYGGYDMVTAKRLWKHVYDRMGGNPSCTSAATCTRKHFERLLLPFEMHLRQQLRSKEPEAKERRYSGSDEGANGNDRLTVNGDPIVQRAYNGESYFINGAKSKAEMAKKPSTSPVHDDAEQDKKPSVTSENLTPRPTVPNKQSSFVKFETLAHNVIREELMTSRASDVKGASPEDLSAVNAKPKDETESSKPPALPSPRPPTSSVAPQVTSHAPQVTSHTAQVTSQAGVPQYARASVIVGASRAAHQHSYAEHVSPRAVSIPTRNFCPRISNAPPPFVPTKSKPPAPMPEQAPQRGKSPAVPSIDLTRPPSSSVDTASSDKLDRTRLQKRPYEEHRPQLAPPIPRAISPSSPKRHRPETAQQAARPPTQAPSSGRYDIRHLMALDERKPEEVRRPVEVKPSPYGAPHSQPLRLPKNHLQQGLRTDAPLLMTSQLTRIPPEARQPRPNFVDPRRLDESQRPVIKPDVRPRPELKRPLNGMPGVRPPIDGRSRPVSPPKRVVQSPAPSSAPPRKESYYRPNGMLATHRQQQKEQLAPANRDPPPRQTPPKPADVRGPVITNGAAAAMEKSKIQYVSRPRTPPQPTSKVEAAPRTPFSSSFSVDRLTADTRNIKLHPASTPQRVAGNVDLKPRVAYSPPEHHNKQTHSSYMKPPERKPSQPHVDAYKLPRRPEYQETPKRPAPPPSVPQLAVPRSPHSKEPGISTLPPNFASALLPHLPPDCSPKRVDQILQEAMKASLAPAPHHNHFLQEALLRQQLDSRLITHQELQAAEASHLAHAARMANPAMQQQQEAALMQMYQQAVAVQQQMAIRQMQEAANSSVAAGKLGQLANGEVLHELARYGAVPAVFTSVPAPGAPRGGAFASAAPPPPHFPADFANAFFPAGYARR